MTLAPERIPAGAGAEVLHRNGNRVLYTDGSYDQGVAGWAVVENGSILLQDWSRGLTSNLAEGFAILGAVKLIGKKPQGIVVTDSLAWADCLNRGRTMKGKGHKSLLEDIYDHMNEDTYFHWVPGHSGDYGNELADMYAKQARLERISRRFRN